MRLPPILLRTRASAIAVLVIAGAAVAGAVAPAAPAPVTSVSRTDLADSSVESVQVEQLQKQLPDTGGRVALVVWERKDGAALSSQDVAAVSAAGVDAAAVPGLLDPAAGGRLPPAQPAPDGTVALVVLPLAPVEGGGDAGLEASVTQVTDLRTRLADAAPPGLVAGVTGGPAFAADLAGVFAGADYTLLLATVGVVALLLLATYRSPLLVVVPLIVVGATEQAAIALAGQVLPRLDLPTGGQVTGIASVLVFGAATDYALLLIARYREQLRRQASPFAAMRTAVSRTAEAVLASGGTVVLALAVLLLSDFQTNRAIAVACIVGVLLAVLAALVVLPAALVLFGRPAFWPFVPRPGDVPREGRLWGRLGERVAAAPVRVLAASAVLLAVMAAGALDLRVGLTQNQEFRNPPEAVTAAERLAAALPAGTTDPLAVLTTPAQVDAVVDAAAAVPGVAAATSGPAGDGGAQVNVVLADEPGSAAADRTVVDLRAALDDAGNGAALVGGGPAERVDRQASIERDQRVVIPLVLLLVGAVLVGVLRSLLAPVLLVATVVASFAAALGVSWVIFDRVLGFPALDGSVVVLAFLFLVALGVDYNIFLTTRAREEAAAAGTRAGMMTALRVTGGVITSAGLLLAAVFAVLGVLPLIPLTQIGVIVCVGVLLDTLLVRTVVVPALAFVLGERFWWPGRPAGRHEAPADGPDAGASAVPVSAPTPHGGVGETA